MPLILPTIEKAIQSTMHPLPSNIAISPKACPGVQTSVPHFTLNRNVSKSARHSKNGAEKDTQVLEEDRASHKSAPHSPSLYEPLLDLPNS